MGRRSTHTPQQLRELILDAAQDIIQAQGLAGLSAREIAVLEALLRRPRRFLSKEQLVDGVYECSDEVTTNAIQHGVSTGTIEPLRIAVIRGQVADLSGAPLGQVTIDILEREGLVEAAARKGEKLLAALKQLGSLESVGDIRGLGLMCGIEFVEDKATKKPFPPARKMGVRVQQECNRRGLVSRIKDDIYMLAPPFVVTDAEIDRMVNILGEAIPAALK